jgi:hypothetical protein
MLLKGDLHRGNAMRTRLLLAGTALITGALLTATPVAHAEPYPAGEPGLTSDTTLIATGGSVQLTGTGYGPNDDVSIDAVYISALGHLGRTAPGPLHRFPVGSTQANAEGEWSTTINLSQTGVATLTATGSPSGVVLTTTVRVVTELPLEDDGDPNTGGGLPITGTRLTTTLIIGTLAVLTGALLIWLPLANRRRGRHTG